MMNQDQYHASLLNKGQPVGLGWDGITKASTPKYYPQDPPNNTDVDAAIQQVRDDSMNMIDLNFNNIKVRIEIEFFQSLDYVQEYHICLILNFCNSIFVKLIKYLNYHIFFLEYI